ARRSDGPWRFLLPSRLFFLVIFCWRKHTPVAGIRLEARYRNSQACLYANSAASGALSQGLFDFCDGPPQRGGIFTTDFLHEPALRLIPRSESFVEFAPAGGRELDHSRSLVVARRDGNKTLCLVDRYHQIPASFAVINL